MNEYQAGIRLQSLALPEKLIIFPLKNNSLGKNHTGFYVISHFSSHDVKLIPLGMFMLERWKR